MRRHSFPHAFTLLELLVVISLLGLLATLTVPVYERIAGASKSAHCMGNLRSLGATLQGYLADHNHVLPELVIAREDKDENVPALDNTLNQYTDGPEIFCCKADNQGLYRKTGTSYLWNHLVNGQSVSAISFMGFITQGSRIPLIGDKENFHKHQDVKVNILYADGHVAKEINFLVNEPNQ